MGSYLDLYRKAIEDNDKAAANSALMEGGLTVLGGLNQIAGITSGIAQINDTGVYDNQISDIYGVGRNGYGSYNDIMNEYQRLNSLQPNIDYDTIRGGSDAERVAGIASSAISGATTGLSVAGPWGALAGGIIGAGAGIGGWLSGNANAKLEEERLNTQSRLATLEAQRNLAAASDNMAEQNFRNSLNIARSGGRIKRQLTAKEFADKVLGRQKPVSSSSGLMIKKCDGGTMIRIKR